MPAAPRSTSALPHSPRLPPLPRSTPLARVLLARVLLASVLVVAAVATAVGAGIPPAAAVPLLPAGRTAGAEPAGTGWGWPLEAAAGQPEVLRSFAAPVHRWSPGHRGVDLAAGPGTPVLAPADGVVVFAGRVVDRGVVSIRGPGGLRATLEPVTATVPAGAVVRRGQPVGVLAGAPLHCAPRSCLHWGVRAGADGYRDPLALLRPAGPPVLLPVLLPVLPPLRQVVVLRAGPFTRVPR